MVRTKKTENRSALDGVVGLLRMYVPWDAVTADRTGHSWETARERDENSRFSADEMVIITLPCRINS